MAKKQLFEYDFTPDQQLISKKQKKSADTPISVKIFMMLILLFAGLFFLGHAIGSGADLFGMNGSLSDLTLAHLKADPLDFKHFSLTADASFLLVWCVITLLYLFPPTGAPKADMKGEEHGSNDFQTIEERKVFMKRCSTGINMLNVDIVKAYEAKHTKETKNER